MVSTESSTSLYNNVTDWPTVAIIVLNWNNYEDTAACLHSLQSIDYPNYHVIVVDNGSTDDSGERLESNFEECQVMYNEDNLGFAAGNNRGIEKAMREGYDYVLLLNNDTVVLDCFLQPLVRSAEKNDRAAIVSGVIYTHFPDKIHSAGMDFSLNLLRPTSITEIKGVEYDVDYISGAMMLFSREFFDQCGLLDESYFFAMEDMEICLRAKKNNWRVLVNSNSQIQHSIGSSSGSKNPFRYYHSTRNRLTFASDHLSRGRRLFFYTFFVLSRLVRFLQWIVCREIRLITSTFLAVYDHLNQNRFKKPNYFDE
ncbi:glycosyltransferase family 2 protein [Haloprofundus halophilus]|uniref:glycosyltransferase family 2 protein n=1 Tax=Haloprofundus halophilus TaxID=2283527 RepID=UPI000E4442EC|nr:glycosyltransferase family 2 protein [Haloprofundus halophilus]